MAKFTNSAQLRPRNPRFQGIETLGSLPPAGLPPPGAFSRLGPRARVPALIGAAAGLLAASCSATSPFSSVPVAIVLPQNQILRGNAWTRIGRGTFEAHD